MSFMSTITEERSDEINNTTDEIEEISEDKEDISFTSSNSKGGKGLTNNQNVSTFNYSNDYVSDISVKGNTYGSSFSRSPNRSPLDDIINGTLIYSSNEKTGVTSSTTEHNYKQSDISYLGDIGDIGVLTSTKTSPSNSIKEMKILTDIPDIGPYRCNSSYVPEVSETKPLKKLDLSTTNAIWNDPSLITYGTYMPSDMTRSIVPYTVEQEKLVFETTNSSSSTGGGAEEIDVTDENEEEHDVCREIKKSHSESLTNEWTRLFKKANEIYKRNQIVKFDEPMSTSESNPNNLAYSDYKTGSTVTVGNKNNTSASNLSEYLKDSNNEGYKTHLATEDIRSIITDYISTGNKDLLNFNVNSPEKTKLYDFSAYKEEDIDSAKNIINRYLTDTSTSVNATSYTDPMISKPDPRYTGSCPSSISPLTPYSQVLISDSLKTSEKTSVRIKDPKTDSQDFALISKNDSVVKKHSPQNKNAGGTGAGGTGVGGTGVGYGHIHQKNDGTSSFNQKSKIVNTLDKTNIVKNSFERLENMNKQYNENCEIIKDLEQKLANVDKEKLSLNCLIDNKDKRSNYIDNNNNRKYTISNDSPSTTNNSPNTAINSPTTINSSLTTTNISPNTTNKSPRTTIDWLNTTNNSPNTTTNSPTKTTNNSPTTTNDNSTATINCSNNKNYTASNKYSSILDLDFEYLEKKIENSSSLPLNLETFTPSATIIQVNKIEADNDFSPPLNVISPIKKDYSSDALADGLAIKRNCTIEDSQNSSSLKMINSRKEMLIKNRKNELNNHDLSIYKKQSEDSNDKKEFSTSNHIKSSALAKSSSTIKCDKKNSVSLEKNSITSVQINNNEMSSDLNQFRNSKKIDSFLNKFHEKKWTHIKAKDINDGKNDLNVKQKSWNNDMLCTNDDCNYKTQKIEIKQGDTMLSGAKLNQDENNNEAIFEHSNFIKEKQIIGLKNNWKMFAHKQRDKEELIEKGDKKKEAKNIVVWDENLLLQRKEDEEVSLSELLLSVNTLLSMSSSTGSNSNEEEGQENSPLGTPQKLDTEKDFNPKAYDHMSVKKNFSNDYGDTYKCFTKQSVNSFKNNTYNEKNLHKNYDEYIDSPSKLELSLDDLNGKLVKDQLSTDELNMFDFINECNELVDEGIEIKDKISHTEKVIGNCLDHMEHELRKAFYQQQDEIQKLRDLLKGKELRIRQLEYENSKLNCDNVTLDDIVEGSLQKSNKKKQTLTSGMIEYSDHSEDGSSSDPEIIEEKEIQAN